MSGLFLAYWYNLGWGFTPVWAFGYLLFVCIFYYCLLRLRSLAIYKKEKSILHLMLVSKIGLSLAIGIALFISIQSSLLFHWNFRVHSELREIWATYAPAYGNFTLATTKEATFPVRQVSWADWEEIAKDNPVSLMIDVRDQARYVDKHIVGSQNIRLTDLLRGEWQSLASVKTSPILLICELGSTGSIGAEALQALGFTNVQVLQFGLEGTYRTNSQLPIYFPTKATNYKPATAPTTAPQRTITVDVRDPRHYEPSKSNLFDKRFFRELATQTEIEKFIKSQDTNHSYEFLCDSVNSCYQAYMLRLEFKDRGYAVGRIKEL